MKKIILSLIVMACVAIACAVPQGVGYNGSAESGARFFISEFDKGGATINPGGTIEIPAGVDLTFKSEPIQTIVAKNSPAITILSYDLEFFSSDPKAVFLTPFYDLPIYVEVPAGEEAKYEGLPAVFPETIQQFVDATMADPTLLDQTVAYRVKMTFHGETEYGYNVKTFFNYALIFGAF